MLFTKLLCKEFYNEIIEIKLLFCAYIIFFFFIKITNNKFCIEKINE